MSKLISTYSGSTGLKISKPNIQEIFYPLPFENYITIQTGSGQPAKNYDLWQEIIFLLKSFLDKNNIFIVHLGSKDDMALQHVYDLRGKTDFLQANFIIKRSKLHLGNDSWLSHCSGWNNIPLITLYGSTSAKNHGPYWFNIDKTQLIESHRGNGVPTYITNESPKTINLIPPEQVANFALKFLNIKEKISFSTHCIGTLYQHFILDLIPNVIPAPNFLPEVPITVRMDLKFDESILAQILSTGRKISLVTANPINLSLLQQYKSQILSYNHEIQTISSLEINYVNTVKFFFPNNHTFFTRISDEKQVSDLRFKFFECINIIQQVDNCKDDYIRETLTYLNLKDNLENRLDIENKFNHTWFKTQKFILSDGKCYLSYPHLQLDQPVKDFSENNLPIINDPTFWKDLQHFYIYYQP